MGALWEGAGPGMYHILGGRWGVKKIIVAEAVCILLDVFYRKQIYTFGGVNYRQNPI